MNSLPVPLWVLIPCALAIFYLGYRRWRRKPERVIKPGTLWLFPALLAAVILPPLYLQPHKPL